MGTANEGSLARRKVMFNVRGTGGGGTNAWRQTIVRVSPVNQISLAFGLKMRTRGKEPNQSINQS